MPDALLGAGAAGGYVGGLLLWQPGNVLPIGAGPDPGWDHHPLDGTGISKAIAERLNQYNAATFGTKRQDKPMWCKDGKARDYALMIEAWDKRRGQMPEPSPLVLPALSYATPQDAFKQFMAAFPNDGNIARTVLPTGDKLVISDDLFRNLAGDWKIAKRGRDQWLMYLAQLIKAPQEIWRRDITMSQELYLLGRFQRGNIRLDGLVVYSRENSAQEWNGKTAFVSDRRTYLEEKRRWLLNDPQSRISWLDV